LWAWFKENYDLLIKKLPPGLSMLGSVVSMCTSNFTSNEQALEVHDFFKDKDTKGFDRALAQSMDTIAAKASWLSRDKEDVQNWLKVNGYLNNDYQNKL
jgi:aminopeptidase 2